MRQKNAALLIAYPVGFWLLGYFTSWKIAGVAVALCVLLLAAMVSEVEVK